jgi:tripartite-type tricarboxylate transporter receptor subunit TctC
MRKLAGIALCCAALLAAGFAQAQSPYPNRPVRLVAPFAPGGPVDVVARLLAPKLSDSLGQQFYVENHPGASGNIGTALVAKAPADGHTVLVISSTLVVNPSLFDKLGFDTEKDLAPISLVGVSPQILLVHPSVPASNLKELIAWVKAAPGQHSYAHAGWARPATSPARCSSRRSGSTSWRCRSTAAGRRSPRPSAATRPSSSPRSRPPPATSSRARCGRWR